MDSGWIVIGIGGATCSGKTTIAAELQCLVPESNLIHQDDYFHPVGSPNLEYIEEIQHYNWDTLSAVDTDRMVEDVKAKLRSPATNTNRILLVEGHLIYNIPSLESIFFRKYFFTVSKEVARIRRRTRRYKRYDERYFDFYAWPLYERHRDEAFGKHADLVVLDGDLGVSVNLQRIVSELRKTMDSGLDSAEPRKDDCRREEDVRVLIIEGTLVLNEPRIHELCSLRYYFTLPYEISKQRRNDKVYEYPDPPMNFDRVVWPQYLKHKAQLINDPTIIFVDCHENDASTVAHLIVSAISELRHIRTELPTS